MKKLIVMAVAALVAAGAFAAEAGWWLAGDDYGITLGGVATDLTAWSTDASAGTSLGTLSSLTLSDAQLHYWVNNPGDPTGINLYFDIYDDQGVKLTDTAVDVWLGHGSKVDGTDHDFALVNSSVGADIYSALEEGKSYGIDMWAKVYGSGDGDKYLPEDSNQHFHAGFTYSTQAAVPEPATMSLLGLGALAMVLRRKLRK